MKRKIFFDTEFIETNGVFFDNMGNKVILPILELISIGMIDQNGKEYYAVSKDFDYNRAYNDNWIRENVLINLFPQSYIDKDLLNKYGKCNANIADDIKDYIYEPILCDKCNSHMTYFEQTYWCEDNNCGNCKDLDDVEFNIEFLAYCGATDFTNLYRIFDTKLLNIPKHFPWYFTDIRYLVDKHCDDHGITRKQLKNHHMYPKNNKEHNALDDAIWNKKLCDLLQILDDYGNKSK